MGVALGYGYGANYNVNYLPDLLGSVGLRDYDDWSKVTIAFDSPVYHDVLRELIVEWLELNRVSQGVAIAYTT